NPQGLNLVEENGVYKIKDKYNGDFKYEKDNSGYYPSYELRNSKNEKISDDVKTEGNPLDSVLIDCEKLNCENKKFRIYQETDENWKESYKYDDREITIKTLPNGKKYGEIQLKKKEQWQEETARFLFPKSYGYSTDFVNDRDLNTNTQQIKLDLDKEFHLWHTQHQLKYGGLYEKTLKSMVNHQYNTAANVQWWADYFFCARGDNGNLGEEKKPQPNVSVAGCANRTLLHSDIGKETYLIPVTTKNNVLYFGDNVQFTSWLGLDLNYRYDHVKYLPGYDEKTPVPGGLIAGIFVPFDEKDVIYGSSAQTILPGYNDCRYTTDCYKNNVRKNLAL
ncbi:TPA: TonB-dependent receptor, partial [Haemophilus influenzae]